MLKDYINIYQASRNSAGMTQERAAELLGVSVESIRDYEGGKRFPPNQIVARMIELYSSPYLAIQHINNSAKELAEFLPQLRENSLQGATLCLLNDLEEVNALRSRIINITCDGKVDESEQEEFHAIKLELKDAVNSIMSFLMAK